MVRNTIFKKCINIIIKQLLWYAIQGNVWLFQLLRDVTTRWRWCNVFLIKLAEFNTAVVRWSLITAHDCMWWLHGRIYINRYYINNITGPDRLFVMHERLFPGIHTEHDHLIVNAFTFDAFIANMGCSVVTITDFCVFKYTKVKRWSL